MRSLDVRRRICLFIVFLFASFGAHAQEISSPSQFSESEVRDAITGALRLLPSLRCGREQCAEATFEELSDPPIEMRDARTALYIGSISASLKWCGIEWEQRGYGLMMQSFRSKQVYDDRMLAVLHIIHNAQLSRDYTNLAALKTCNAAQRAALEEDNPQAVAAPWQQQISLLLQDEGVASLLQRVLGEIGNSKCGALNCPPATPAERANPPITIQQARQAMQVGLMSGTAAHCDVDWQRRIFLPYMRHNRHLENLSPRQLALISMIHGTMQGVMLDGYKKNGESCTDQIRASLEDQLKVK